MDIVPVPEPSHKRRATIAACRLFDEIELEYIGSVCPMPSGDGVESTGTHSGPS